MGHLGAQKRRRQKWSVKDTEVSKKRAADIVSLSIWFFRGSPQIEMSSRGRITRIMVVCPSVRLSVSLVSTSSLFKK